MGIDHLAAFLVVFAAYFVRGLTGFGSGLIAIPILAQFQPLTLVVPVIMALDFIASFIIGGVDRSKTDWGEVRLLVPFGLVGALFGTYVLVNFPSAPVLAALACFTIFFGARNALGIQPQGEISRLWAIPAGIVGSGAGAVFGTSAPPYIMYLAHRLPDKSAARATFSWLFIIDGGFRLTLFALAGLLLTPTAAAAIALGLIPLGIGLYAGNHVHVRISREQLLRWVGGFLVVSGATLLARALA
jgi:uncharacterized membrane protein YfcA